MKFKIGQKVRVKDLNYEGTDWEAYSGYSKTKGVIVKISNELSETMDASLIEKFKLTKTYYLIKHLQGQGAFWSNEVEIEAINPYTFKEFLERMK
jgi:hypothetical protein